MKFCVIAMMLLFLASGCSDNDMRLAGDAGTFIPPGSGDGISGAWYGAGAGFPDGELCLLLCPDSDRAFLGDSMCTETDRSDFSGYYTYTSRGSALTVTDGDRTFEFDVAVMGTSATFTFEGDALAMRRTAASSSLCTDPTIPARPLP